MSVVTFDPSLIPTLPCQLINIEDQSTVVLFSQGIEGPAKFTEDYSHIEASMKLVGIPIPPHQKQEYSLSPDRVAIRLDDPLFGKAFFEIHYKNNMNQDVFHWKKV
ncbi:MAG: hypothetical protein HKM07_01050 [Chlamydiae bacterium]|nr:hypothetical protein [Chlamydiota bacterium]